MLAFNNYLTSIALILRSLKYRVHPFPTLRTSASHRDEWVKVWDHYPMFRARNQTSAIPVFAVITSWKLHALLHAYSSFLWRNMIAVRPELIFDAKISVDLPNCFRFQHFVPQFQKKWNQHRSNILFYLTPSVSIYHLLHLGICVHYLFQVISTYFFTQLICMRYTFAAKLKVSPFYHIS